jgi:nicotinate dehydrogenase subunit B
MKNPDLSNPSPANPLEKSGLKRRSFIKLLGGGIFIFFQPWNPADLLSLPADQRRSLTKEYNAFLQIAEDGTIKCFTGKIEMGQGIITSLAMMMAEELNVPYERISMVMGDTDLCPYDAGTWGSQSVQTFGPAMMAAAAEARAVLTDLASARLGVPVTEMDVKDGVVFDTKNPAKKISYGQLAKGKKIEKRVDVTPKLEDYTKFTIVGKPMMRKDSRLKVTGEAKYAGDLRLPGMVYARILRPQSHGAKLKSADVSGAEKIPGIQVVRDGDFIAVLSEDRDTVDQAVVGIKAEYTFDELPVNDTNLYDRMVGANSRVEVAESLGDMEAGAKASDKIFESEFHDPYLAHAAIETHTALANLEGDKMTVWASTQSPFGLQDSIVRELGFPVNKVRVITPFVGGGFGGKAPHQQGVEAARLAKLVKKPVMVVWSREEEFFYDTFRPAAVVRVRSGIDKARMIKLWDYRLFYGGSRGSDAIYDVPNVKRTFFEQNMDSAPIHPFGTGAWRAPSNNTNTWARETQIDIMASAAGIDPLEFRLKNLKDERMIACLKAAADKFGYVPAKSPGGRGIGVACGTDAGSWVALIAELRVDKSTGHVQVIRVACAQDMGLSVNPQGSLLQIEGCIIMSLGYALGEEVMFEGGNVRTRGFDSYLIPHFSWVPKIDAVILDRKDKPPKGGGEPAIITMGALVSNGIFDATGARLFRMPMTPERVLEALKMV